MQVKMADHEDVTDCRYVCWRRMLEYNNENDIAAYSSKKRTRNTDYVLQKWIKYLFPSGLFRHRLKCNHDALHSPM